MPYEKKSYKKFNGKGKTTLNPESLTLNQNLPLNPSPLTLNQGRPEPKRKRGKLASSDCTGGHTVMQLDVILRFLATP